MKKITKNLRCTVTLEIDQEIELTEIELKQLEESLEKSSRIRMYISQGEGLTTNPIYDILNNNIDLDYASDMEIDDVELEDIN